MSYLDILEKNVTSVIQDIQLNLGIKQNKEESIQIIDIDNDFTVFQLKVSNKKRAMELSKKISNFLTDERCDYKLIGPMTYKVDTITFGSLNTLKLLQ